MFLSVVALLSSMLAGYPTTPSLSNHTLPVEASTPTNCPTIVVQSGDTMSGIAATYNITWPRLAALNNLSDPSLIYPQQKLTSCGTLTDNDVAVYLQRIQPAPTQVQHIVQQPQPIYQQPAKNQPVQQPVYQQTVQQPVQQSGGSVVDTIRAVFGGNANAAINVARCESGFNPGATNSSSGAAGVFQFLASTWRTTPYAGSNPYNADANIRAAYSVFVRDGYSWREWSCQP